MNVQVKCLPEDEYAEISSFFDLTLPSGVFSQPAIDSDIPYTNDQEIFDDFSILHMLCDLAADFRNGYLKVLANSNQSISVSLEERTRIIEFLDKHICRFRTKIEERIDTTRKVGTYSRFLRIAVLLDLSIREREVVAYMVNAMVGVHPFSNYDSEIKALRSVCGMTISEIFHFLDDERKHISQELVQIKDGVLSSTILRCDFRLSADLAQVLLSKDTAGEEALKCGGNAIAKLLLEEDDKEIDCIGEIEGENDDKSQSGSMSGRQSENEEEDLDFDLHEYLFSEKDPERHISAPSSVAPTGTTSEGRVLPYTNDKDYLNDVFQAFLARAEWKETQEKEDYQFSISDISKDEQARIARGKMLKKNSLMKRRLQITREMGSWLPRFERLAQRLNLDEFERNVILTLTGMTFVKKLYKSVGHGFRGRNTADVDDIISFLEDSLDEQMERRRYFYRNAKLVVNGVIDVSGDWQSDILDFSVSLDRRMIDHIAGQDTEISQIVDGGNLYFPRVTPDDVILPEEMKKEILDIVTNSQQVEKIAKKGDTRNTYTVGCNTILLFYGEPGTGKTRMANALANHLGKKVCLMNFPTLGTMNGDKILRYFDREAKVNNAIKVYDEADQAWMDRDKGNGGVTTLLTEIERQDGIIILITNRPFDIDKAMESRMAYRFEFKRPDMHHREKIWQYHLPANVTCAEDVNLRALAMRYEFSGRYIKNSVLGALSYALARDEENLILTQDDLERGAKMQLRGHLARANLERSIIPTHGLERVVLPGNLKEAVYDIIKFEKAKPILQDEWDFKSVVSYGYGNGVLLYGPPGTGKTMTAEAIGYEIGCPLMKINISELFSKYVGETAKNIDAFFKSAINSECAVVLDDSEGLLGGRTIARSATDKHANVELSLMLEHIERFPGLVIIITNHPDIMDKAIKDRIKHKLQFSLPTRALRAEIWRSLIPAKAPLAEDVDFKELARRYSFNGRTIKNCVLKAAAKAAVRKEGERKITMADFSMVADLEIGLETARKIGF